MRFDRKLWVVKHYDVFPAWPCPTCEHGVLEMSSSKQHRWLVLETNDSKEAHDHDEWSPDWTKERAAGFLCCRSCSEPVAALTLVDHEECEYLDRGRGVRRLYQPCFFEPAIPMIAVPGNASGMVKIALRRAFSLYWSDPASSGNCLRTALEFMLDQEGVPRARNDSHKHKRNRLTLHARLELIKARRASVFEPLLALKWLGNAGTHDVLTHDDVLAALELLDHCFDEIYRDKSRTIMRTAKAINRRKGPVRPRLAKK